MVSIKVTCLFDQEKGRLSFTTTFFILVAVLITGGRNPDLKTAELFLPSAGTSCTLPKFPEGRYSHTVDNNIMCGGPATWTSCLKWSPDTGSWEELLTLDIGRYYHVSWTPEPESDMGTYLMGGSYSPRTTTLIKDDRTQESAFQLKHDTV